MKASEAVILNDEYVAVKMLDGNLTIFAYFMDDGEIVRNVYAGSISLDEKGQKVLSGYLTEVHFDRKAWEDDWIVNEGK